MIRIKRSSRIQIVEVYMCVSCLFQEDDDEFDLPRRPFRRRAMSVSSRLSTSSVSSTMRPLPAPTPLMTPDYSPESPLLIDKQVKYKPPFFSFYNLSNSPSNWRKSLRHLDKIQYFATRNLVYAGNDS